MDLKSLQSFDWRSLEKYFSAQASDDLNDFLEALPQNAGNTILIVAAVTWSVAAVVGLYVSTQMERIAELKSEIESVDALQPSVPIIREANVPPQQLQNLASKIDAAYKGVKVAANGSNIAITGRSTAAFGQFREAMGYIQNGGKGWKVTINKLCVGRECSQNELSAELKVSKVSVEEAG